MVNVVVGGAFPLIGGQLCWITPLKQVSANDSQVMPGEKAGPHQPSSLGLLASGPVGLPF
jgi:hypothetical protein